MNGYLFQPCPLNVASRPSRKQCFKIKDVCPFDDVLPCSQNGAPLHMEQLLNTPLKTNGWIHKMMVFFTIFYLLSDLVSKSQISGV